MSQSQASKLASLIEQGYKDHELDQSFGTSTKRASDGTLCYCPLVSAASVLGVSKNDYVLLIDVGIALKHKGGINILQGKYPSPIEGNASLYSLQDLVLYWNDALKLNWKEIVKRLKTLKVKR